MPKEQFTRQGLTAVAVGAVVIIVAAALAIDGGVFDRVRSFWKIETPPPGKGFLVQSVLPGVSATTTKEDVAKLLLSAFQAHTLFEAAEWAIPQSSSTLVLATPTSDGTAQPIDCGLQSQPYCGLYVVSSSTSRLLVWGSDLAGFHDLERYPDPHHVIISKSWSFMNFASIDRIQVDLDTGETIPLLRIELDMDENGADLSMTGNGTILTARVDGALKLGHAIPKRVSLKDENDKEIYVLPSDDVVRLAAAGATGTEPAPLVFIKPTPDDLETQVVHIDLSGVPYAIDLKKRTLNAE